FFFSSRRRHTISKRDWSSDVCSSDLIPRPPPWLRAASVLPSITILIPCCLSEDAMNRYTTPSSDIPFIDAVWRQALPPSSAIEQAAALALPVAASRQAQDAIQRWEHYSPTPLHAL